MPINNKATPSHEETYYPQSGISLNNGAGANDEIFGFHPGGVNALFGDGSVKFVLEAINNATFQALGTRRGKEVISGDAF